MDDGAYLNGEPNNSCLSLNRPVAYVFFIKAASFTVGQVMEKLMEGIASR